MGIMSQKRSPEVTMESTGVKKQAVSCLDAIKNSGTVIVADTADFGELKAFNATDGTTNPSLILQASQIDKHSAIIDKAIADGKATGKTGEELVLEICDELAVSFGCEILKIVPGVVSTEVDACLSFDTEKSVAKAHKIIDMYAKRGISKDRILIKMASTWEGCQAAQLLEKEGIRTNMTLLFSMCQAVAAAEAGAYLISPFVGRILDFHKKENPDADYSGMNDPGVQSVSEIYNYYKKFGYSTVVMGASFRSVDEIKNLTGCDRVTVSPKLLGALDNDTENSSVTRKLSPESAKDACRLTEKIAMDEATFRWMLNQDDMGTFKLAEGIRNFNKDAEKLKQFVMGKL